MPVVEKQSKQHRLRRAVGAAGILVDLDLCLCCCHLLGLMCFNIVWCLEFIVEVIWCISFI